MITDHCTLLLADSALSHTSNSSQADSDINVPLDHMTSSFTSTSTRQHSQDSNTLNNGYHSNDGYHSNGDTPTAILPKK